MRTVELRAAWALAALALGGVARGEEGPAPLDAGQAESGTNLAAEGATQITSERLVYEMDRRVAVFEGGVVVRDAVFTMECDQLTVVLDEARRARAMTARGNVRMRRGDMRARAAQAVYLADKDEVLLHGGAVMERGGDRLAGEKIAIALGSERVTCEKGTLVLTPETRAGEVPTLREVGAGGEAGGGPGDSGGR